MAISNVQDLTGNSGGSATSASLTVSSTAGGNLLVIGITTRIAGGTTATVSSVTDNIGNTWVKAVAQNPTSGSTPASADIWYVANATAGVTSVTVHLSTSASMIFRFHEVSGIATSSPLDQTAGNTGASTSPSSGATATTTLAAEFVFGIMGQGGTPTYSGEPGGWTVDATDTDGGTTTMQEVSGYQITTSTGAFTWSATSTTSATWSSVVATFKGSGTTLAIAAAGTVSTSGSLAATLRMPLAAAGTVSTSGSLAAGVVSKIAASGTVSTSGSMAATTGVLPLVIAASGTVSTSGSLAVIAKWAVAAAGTVTPAGSLGLGFRFALAAAGTEATSGSAGIGYPLPFDAHGTVLPTGQASFFRVPYVPVESIVTTCSSAFLAALTSSHVIATLCEVWAGNTKLATFVVLPTSSITVDRKALIRRRCSLVLVDIAGQWTPVDATSLFTPYGNELRLYRGIVYPNGDQEFVRLGVFGIETVDVDDTGVDVVIKVEGFDRARAIQRAGLTNNQTVAPVTNVGTAIQALIAGRQVGLASGTFMFSPTTLSTPAEAVLFKAGDDPWAKAAEMATAVGMELFFDTSGNCVLQPVPDPTMQPIAWSFDETTDEQLATKMTRRLTRADAENYIVAIGQGNGLTAPVRAVSSDQDSTSPTWVGGKYGVFSKTITSNLYTTTAQAQAAADMTLRLTLGTVESMALSSIPRPDTDVDNVIAVTRSAVGIATGAFYVVDGFTLALGDQATLDATTRRVNRTS